MRIMLTKTMPNNTRELYSVYYLTYGSLSGTDTLIKEYFWSGPYPDPKSAFQAAQALKISHDHDDSFIVRRDRI